ncbi:MAG: hypothetical protein ACSHXF_06250 [Aquaticitalea sp.]
MPVGEYMFSSLKSNKNIMLDKTKRFKKTLGGYGDVDNAQFDFPETSPDVLSNIRNRLQKEERRLLTKQLILFCAITIIILSIVIY